ncbi:unnamed protein product [Closterium sp. NIES-54]
MDMWGPARVSKQGRERYFMLVVDDYTRYTTVFPLRSKGEVPDVMIPWIRAVCLQLRERFHQDLTVLRLHSVRGGEFSSDLLRDFCRGEGILQSFTLPASLQQNEIAERCIGLVMEVTRTSMIHAAAPHFLWPFMVRYAAHQLNLWPCVSLPETSPTLRWTGKVGDASVLQVWGFRAFVRDTSADKLSARAIPCVAFDSGAARAAASGGAEPGGAKPAGAEPGEGAKPGGAEFEGAESGGAERGGTLSPGGPPSALLRREPLSPPQLREWFARRTRLWSGAAGAGGSAAGDNGAQGPGGTGAGAAGGTGFGAAGGTGAASPGGARTGGPGAVGAGGAAGVGAGDSRARETGAGGAGPGVSGAVGAGSGDTRRPRPYFVPLLQQVLGLPSSTGLTPPLLCPPPDQSQPPLQPASPLPAPSPYTEQTGGLIERREPVSHPASPVRAIRTVRTGRHVPRQRPPPVLGTHHMALCPSSVPQHVPMSSPPASSLANGPDPESNLVRAASPTVPRLLANVLTDTSFESAAASVQVAELVEFSATCRLDYTASLVAKSESDCPPSGGGECALGTDVLEDRQEDFECFAATIPHLVSMLIAPEGDPDAPDIPTPRSYAKAITGPYSSQWQAAMDQDMASWKSTSTYVDVVPPHEVNIVDVMWIFRVKRPPGSPPAFKARYVARGFTQRDYELHSLDFSTAFLQGSLHEEIWLRRPPGFTGSFPASTQWSLRRPVYGLRQVPREWHDTLRMTLATLGFAPSNADPSLFLRTDTLLPPFYVLVYVDDLVFATADTEALTLVKSKL